MTNESTSHHLTNTTQCPRSADHHATMLPIQNLVHLSSAVSARNNTLSVHGEAGGRRTHSSRLGPRKEKPPCVRVNAQWDVCRVTKNGLAICSRWDFEYSNVLEGRESAKAGPRGDNEPTIIPSPCGYETPGPRYRVTTWILASGFVRI